MQVDIEIETAALYIGAEPAGIARRRERLAQDAVRQRVLRAQVDVTLVRAHRETGNRHGLDQAERIAFHEHAVGERAAVAFIGVARDVLLLTLGIGDRAPLDAGREARAAAAAQPRFGDEFDDLVGADLPGLLQCLETLV